MIDDLWNLFWRHLSGERAKDYVQSIWETARYSSWDKYNSIARDYARELMRIGLENVELVELPADGKTSFGGILIPKKWKVKEGRLEVISPVRMKLADYGKVPCSLMMYSSSTPAGGVVCDLCLENEGDVSGRIVLSSKVLGRGELGLISDGMVNYKRDPSLLRDAVQWHNFTINPFYDYNMFGFSISPARGRDLRKLLKKGRVRVRARVETVSRRGKLLLPTGLIRGRSSEEVVVTGHLFEQGANDNASGAGLALEIACCLKELIGRELPVPKRSIRILPSLEVRGMQAYANLHRDRLPLMTAGIVLDMVGTEESKYPLVLSRTPPANPAYTDYLFEELLNLFCRGTRFRWNSEHYDINDNVLSEPSINVPTCVLSFRGDSSWHTSVDTMDTIFSETLKRVGVLAACYLYLIANAGLEEAKLISRLVFSRIKKRDFSEYELKKVFDSVLKLVERNDEKKKLRAYQSGLKKELMLRARSEKEARPVTKLEREAARMVPKKDFLGFVGFDDLSPEELKRFREITGKRWWWISSHRINSSLFYSNGRRNLFEIWNLVQKEGERIELSQLIELFLFLEKRKLVSIKKGRIRKRKQSKVV